MITDFADFCLCCYVLIDDLWRQLAPLFPRPGPEPVCSDSELITMALVGECRGWDRETTLLHQWREYPHLFPRLPERSRFNRRRRQLAPAINALRQRLLRGLDVALAPGGVIDSLPVPVVKFHWVPNCAAEWAEHGARFGKVPSKKQTIFGYKLHLLVTWGGVILDFELAPAHATDLAVGEELLAGWPGLVALGDKGYTSAKVAERLREEAGVVLLVPPRRNQKRQLPEWLCRQMQQVRSIIETVNGQLADQFQIESNHAHTFGGLCARLSTKLTAHTLCVSLNRRLGNADFLQIKALAFPN
jgi:DDE family transposase